MALVALVLLLSEGLEALFMVEALVLEKILELFLDPQPEKEKTATERKKISENVFISLISEEVKIYIAQDETA